MPKSYFFNLDKQYEFTWPGDYKLRAGAVRPENKSQISNGLRYMSPEAIRNRFQGSKRSFSEQELVYLTNLDGINHYAFGIEEREKLKRGVAIIRLVRSSHDRHEGEVAITIIDDFQKMGLGTFLMDIIILAALEREITKLSFTFLPQNTGIIKLIKRLGVPEIGSQTHDQTQLFLDLKKIDVQKVKSRLEKYLPEIGSFHLET